MDGTHVPINLLIGEDEGGTIYYNYKGFYSVVTDWCNANYKILWCEVGANGAASQMAKYSKNVILGEQWRESSSIYQ